MAFRTFALAMSTRAPEPPPFATAIPALFEALLDVFAPLDVTYRVDDDEPVHVTRIDAARAFQTRPLWCDEELTRDALTRCKPALGTDVVAELWGRLAGTRATTFVISAEGALRHRAAGTVAPAWYGRWQAAALHELASVGFTWTRDPLRGFELRCPLAGYPFTAVRPMVRGDLAAGDRALAAENRELLFPALCGVRAALGFDHAEVRWVNDGDYGGSYPDDRNDIWKRWLPRLRES